MAKEIVAPPSVTDLKSQSTQSDSNFGYGSVVIGYAIEKPGDGSRCTFCNPPVTGCSSCYSSCTCQGSSTTKTVYSLRKKITN
ncbi:hypothetical protein V1498_12350 [Peribacillus sp. SCS-26]|uniref:hypothetical protein n=1 Tax=Paraperibacillus marinus TaxID=3115295 RepID=UPI0039067663